jgi:hypothetical protein
VFERIMTVPVMAVDFMVLRQMPISNRFESGAVTGGASQQRCQTFPCGLD